MNVLLIGYGRMGQRYERVARKLFGKNLNLFVIDPLAEEVADAKVFRSLEDVPPDIPFQLGIDAHPNYGRLQILEKLGQRGVKKVIVEKPSAKSLNESQKMLTVADQLNIDVFLPFFRRYHQYQSENLEKLDAGKLCHIQVTCGAIGLGCNGVHLIDMASSLFGAFPSHVNAQLKMNSIVSPRGPQYMDHGGTLWVHYPNGEMSLNILSQSAMGVQLQLLFENGRILVTEQLPKAAWHWWRREEQTLPLYRTNMEVEVTPPEPWSASLEDTMEHAIGEFLKGGPHPGLKEGHATLATIASAILSTDSHGRAVTLSEAEKHLGDYEFHFT